MSSLSDAAFIGFPLNRTEYVSPAKHHEISTSICFKQAINEKYQQEEIGGVGVVKRKCGQGHKEYQTKSFQLKTAERRKNFYCQVTKYTILGKGLGSLV